MYGVLGSAPLLTGAAGGGSAVEDSSSADMTVSYRGALNSLDFLVRFRMDKT